MIIIYKNDKIIIIHKIIISRTMQLMFFFRNIMAVCIYIYIYIYVYRSYDGIRIDSYVQYMLALVVPSLCYTHLYPLH